LVAGTSVKFLPQGFTSVGVLYPTQYANSKSAKVHCGTSTRTVCRPTPTWYGK
jgi:hypothetical protein